MRVHLVDGTYELFRAYFGAPKAKDPHGREVGAVRGLIRMWLSWIERAGITHVGFAFDHVIESFRNDLFAGYKTSLGVPADLMAQFELAERAAYAIGGLVWPMVAFEADDALATAAARFAVLPEVEQVRVCTPDKDLAQVVGSKVVGLDRFKDVVLDEAGVVAKFGVAPESIPDFLALVGDDADGIPGIPRWGQKSAGLVLARWRHLEAIPTDPLRWDVPVRGAPALAATLNEQRSDAILYRTLATLRTDAPVTESLADLEWRGARKAELETLCDELGDRPRPTRWRE